MDKRYPCDQVDMLGAESQGQMLPDQNLLKNQITHGPFHWITVLLEVFKYKQQIIPEIHVRFIYSYKEYTVALHPNMDISLYTHF